MPEPKVRLEHTYLSEQTIVVGASPVASFVAEKIGCPKVSYLNEVLVGRSQGKLRNLIIVGNPGDFDSTIDPLAMFDEQALDEIIAAADLQHCLLLSSAMCRGAWPNRALIVDDEKPLELKGNTQVGYVSQIANLELAFEKYAATHLGPCYAILGCTALVGPGIDTLTTRHFEAPRLLVAREESKDWQFLHLEDLVSAIEVVIDQELTGIIMVGPLDVDGNSDLVTTSEILAISGLKEVVISAKQAFSLGEGLSRVGIISAPVSDLNYSIYPWNVWAKKLYDHGWRNKWSSKAGFEYLIKELHEQKRSGQKRGFRPDATTLGAAGAAVAVLATAAILRRTRRG